MIGTFCALAAVSVGGAVLAAHKLNSHKTERTVVLKKDTLALGQESSDLSKLLVDELSRMQVAAVIHPTDVEFVTKSLESIIRNTWDEGGYYYKDYVIPFINILRASCILERNDPSAEYLKELKNIVHTIGTACAEANIREETGEITSFTYSFMVDRLSPGTNQLERLNRKRISSS